MAEVKSDYTEKDKEKIRMYLKKYPDAWTWGTLGGLWIPLPLIKTPHLVNIKKHIEDHSIHYPRRVLETIEKELYKRMTKTKAGKVLYGEK